MKIILDEVRIYFLESIVLPVDFNPKHLAVASFVDILLIFPLSVRELHLS